MVGLRAQLDGIFPEELPAGPGPAGVNDCRMIVWSGEKDYQRQRRQKGFQLMVEMRSRQKRISFGRGFCLIK